jgi:hypothetical protein
MRFRYAALLFTAAATAAAQAPTLEPNTPVRVDMRDRTIFRGILTSQTLDSAFVWTTAAGRHQALAWGSVATVRIDRGRSHAAGARKGLAVGALAGLALGAGLAVIGLLTEPNMSPSLGNAIGGTFMWALSGFIAGAIEGFLIGGIVGARQWDTVYPVPVARLP